MTVADLKSFLTRPYQREGWLQTLRGVLPQTEIFSLPQPLASPDDRAEYHGMLSVFLTPSPDYRFTFASRVSEFDADGNLTRKETAPRRYTYILGPNESCRTAAERFSQLSARAAAATLADVVEAFSVEKLNKEFFADFCRAFDRVSKDIRKHHAKWSDADVERDAQTLLDRLVFLYFVQRKGWLSRQRDYLFRHFRENHGGKAGNTYLTQFLRPLFVKLSTEGAQADIPGHDLPFLNGGLFNDEYGDEHTDESTRRRTDLVVANETFHYVFENLLERYNFTIHEDSPTNQEVAIDPEMLGKIFESLVLQIEQSGTGGKSLRHDTGSHYTPRPIVHYLCVGALAAWLESQRPFAGKADAIQRIAKLLSLDAGEGLNDEERATLNECLTPDEAAVLLDRLATLRACDPAVGSGAFPMGLLREILNLARLCETRARGRDPVEGDRSWLYETKKRIIERVIYGVDIQERAIEICKLRLWLSLMVDHDLGVDPANCDPRSFRKALADLEPLPNLDFKIRRADSLVDKIHGEPIPLGKIHLGYQAQQALNELTSAKRDFYAAERAAEKRRLRAVEKLQKAKRISVADIEQALGDIREFFDSPSKPTFVWHLDFAEVFFRAEQPRPNGDGGLPLATPDASKPRHVLDGFDIVLANPPYVRMELIKPLKPMLRQNYPHVHDERTDLYVYFYARAQELLRAGGVGAFISSNKWLRAGYGEKLRQFLLDEQEFRQVVDFGELPVFEAAATFPAIFVWRKQPRAHSPTTWAVVRDLAACYVEGIANFVARSGQVLPASQFGKGKPRLTAPGKADVMGKMEGRGPRLKEYVSGQIGWGVKTGLNEAFVIDRTTRDNLISESARSAEVIKPLLVGDDVRRYERHFRESYLIYMRHGVRIRDYPAIERHLKPFKARLENRATGQGWYELQQPQEAYVPLFEAPKTIYPDIGKVTRFAIDEDNYYGSNTTYFIARADWYLLGVLNSAASFDYLRGTCAALGDEQDGGRLRFFGQYLETLPIPNAPDSERATIAKLAKEAQRLHGQRRARVERFLCEVGLEPPQSTSRNSLEQPWSLPPEEFTRRAPRPDVKKFTPARDETAALTQKIQTVEREIDARVAALYGL